MCECEDETNCQKCADNSAIEAELRTALDRARVREVELERAIYDIGRLVLDLPSGIDYEADSQNESPNDMQFHIGGLIWRICNRVLPSCG